MNLNAVAGWGLAVLAVALGYAIYGWPGVALAVTMVVFWLLLQFTRALRVMRDASAAPKALVGSAVMLHSKLQAGLRMMEVLKLTRSLGERVSEAPEVWRWRDEGGAAVTLEFSAGRLARWQLQRPEEPPAA